MKESESEINDDELGTTVIDDLITSEIVVSKLSSKGIRIIEEQSSIL